MKRRLLESITIGNVTLKNRIVFPPMTTGFEHQGQVSQRSIHFYRTIARGGAGLIILGDVSIQPTISQIPYLYNDTFVEGLSQLTQAVHAEGAKISAQLFHQEYNADEVLALFKEKGKSAALKQIQADMKGFCNRQTDDDIQKIIGKFVQAAKRAQAAGFDMIQIHGDRLIGMFSSPKLNQRSDAYGGTLKNRAKFAIKVVRAVQEAVPELPLEFKLSIIRSNPPKGNGGPSMEEAPEFAKMLLENGIAAFHVCQANHGFIGDVIPPMGTQPYGCFVDMAHAIKSAVHVPVTAVGRIVLHDFAEHILDENKADLVAIGRGLMADPEWPKKYEENRTQDCRYCIMCNGCLDHILKQQPLACTINAELGLESQAPLRTDEHSKNVLVIGGGPAGMEAARIAALRGHRVTLYEKRNRLGGQLNLCVAVPHKHEMKLILDFLCN